MTFLVTNNNKDNYFNESDFNNPKKMFLALLAIGLIAAIVLIYSDYSEKSDLKEYDYTWGIIRKKSSVYGTGNWLYIDYTLDKKWISSSEVAGGDCFHNIGEGDTILIRYSLKNPKTVKVEQCYWNSQSKEELSKLKFR